jgi:predicted amidohydrolase YtcJ
MKSTAALIALAIALTAPGTARAQTPAADLILTNARVYTADAARPRAQAVAIRDGRIVFVGSDLEAAALRGSATRTLDLDGKTVLPGMIDDAQRVAETGEMTMRVDHPR